MKIYILVYSNAVGSRERIKKWANSSPAVYSWRYDLPNTFYIVSNNTATELSESLRKFSRLGRYLFTEIGDNRNGYLPPDTWQYLKKHKAINARI